MLMKNVLKPLSKSGILPSGLTVAATTAEAGIYQEILGSGTTTPIISKADLESNMKIVESLEDSDLLIRDANFRRLV